MDFVPIVNGIAANVAQMGEAASDQYAPLLEFFKSNAVAMITFGLLIAVVYGFLRRIWKRLSSTIEDTLFSNWRLALLGATGLVLSLASGWTTWDGMKNFTAEPTLSLMITFGIQGVMLIVAWLIGESFASGMNHRAGERSIHTVGIIGGILAAMVIVASAVGLFYIGHLPVSSEGLLFGAVAAGFIVLVGFLQWDLFQPYLQSTRIIMRNAVLWVMFLACMATSVFFSFDSLFSTIFPAEERARAAQLRAQNHVSGIVADIGENITTRRQLEAERLFDTDGWKLYEQQLDKLAAQAQGSQQLIEDYFVSQMEARRAAIAKQQDRIATAESSQAALSARKIQLDEENARLVAERPALVSQVSQHKQVIAGLERKFDEQRALTLAEERGVEGSGKEGRGKFWRASKELERRIRAEIEVATRRLNSPQSRLAQIDKRRAIIKGELAQVEGEIAKLKGISQTANQRIAAASRSFSENTQVEKVDPARVLPTFEKAKAAFRQDPTADKLNALHTQCTQLYSAMLSTPATKERVRAIDCDPKQAGEAASSIFALDAGAAMFAQNCAGGDKLERISTTDGLFAFSRKCLADSGLPSDATEKLRQQINYAELNRDDKAHRFVVTWNAFQDGNRLAILALAIAIAIDLLVFMSGLFGANAVRSPLQDVPSQKARSASQLEAIIENALLPDKYTNAHATISAMQPITPVDGFTQEVIIPFEETPDRARVLKVLNAGSAIGAVERDPLHPERYFIRPELFEFLSFTAKTCFEKEENLGRLADLRGIVTVALQPYVGDHAEIVLNNMHPINERDGFSSEILMEQVSDNDKSLVRKVLNAGTTLNFAQQDERKGEESRYYIHKELYKTIAMIAATIPKQGKRLGAHAQITGPLPNNSPAVQHGGDLTDRTRALDHQAEKAPAQGEENEKAPSPHSPGSSAGASNNRHDVNPAQLERYYRDELLEALQLRPGTDREIILSGDEEVHQAASESWKALLHRATENRPLHDFIAQFERDRKDRFQSLYEKFKRAVHANSKEAAALDKISSKVFSAWPILMMHPDTGLVQMLINRLDEAASSDGMLKPEDHDLRERLTSALATLRSNKLVDALTWQKVENVIAQIAPHSSQVDMPNVLRDRDATPDKNENIIPIKPIKRPNGTNV